MKVRLLKRHEIEDEKWDECIINSRNCRHYAMSWYLNIVSPGWHGIIYGDYNAVMPIPRKQKFGFSIILQPFLCQQLGIFSSEKLSTELLNKFYRIFKKLHPVVYNTNLLNSPDSSSGIKLEYLPNIELDMNKDHSDLRSRFSKNTKRNISKAKKEGLTTDETEPNEDVFDFIFENLRFSYSSKEQGKFRKVVEQSFSREECVLIACKDSHRELLSIGFFISHKNRITFLGSSSSEKGYQKQAAFLIFDTVIENYSSRDFVLDFEGSKNEGIARFYKGFGGKVTEYGQIKTVLYPIVLMFEKIKRFFL